jgi:hypothetical protein
MPLAAEDERTILSCSSVCGTVDRLWTVSRVVSLIQWSATRKVRGSPFVTIAIALTKDFPALVLDSE